MKNISLWFGVHWLTLVAMITVTVAIGVADLPFAYFQLMNWSVVGAAALIALRSHNAFVMWIFIAVAVVFNPIAPIFLRTDIWQIADIAVVACFFLSLFISDAKN